MGGPEIQAYPWLLRECEANLDYMHLSQSITQSADFFFYRKCGLLNLSPPLTLQYIKFK